MTDFVTNLKKDIINSMPSVSKDWAEYNAIITLSTVLSKVRIVEKEKPISLNLIMLMIGPSGIKKSLPMFAFTYPIIKEVGHLLGNRLIFPSRSSVPGIIKYVAGKMNEDPKDETKHTEGVILRDEFSGLFKGMRAEGWQSDGMEFISEMYDGIYQLRATTTHGLNNIDALYGCLISCSTYYFISLMDPEFFTQGTGNRFLWCHYSAEEYDISPIDPVDYFREGWADKRERQITKYAKQLESLYNTEIKNIYVGDDAGKLWVEYHNKCEKEWKKKAIEDPLGWEYHPVKRYAELALKLSGIYAISRQIDRIPNMPTNHLSNFTIIKEDMERAINLVERNRGHFRKVVAMKRKNLPREKPKSQIEVARSMLPPLASSKYQMLSAGEWMSKVDTVTNTNKQTELKQLCFSHGWVKIANPTPELRRKLGVTSNNIQICRYVKGLEP